jgi:hypothetical protein
MLQRFLSVWIFWIHLAKGCKIALMKFCKADVPHGGMGYAATLPVVWAKLKSKTHMLQPVRPLRPSKTSQTTGFLQRSQRHVLFMLVCEVARILEPKSKRAIPQWTPPTSYPSSAASSTTELCRKAKIRRHHHHHHQHHHHHHHHHPTFTCSSVSAIFSEAVGSDYLIRVSHGSRLGLPTLVVTANRSPEVLSAGIVFPRRPVGWPILKRPRSNATRPTHWSDHLQSMGGKHGGFAPSGVERTLPTSEESVKIVKSCKIPIIWWLNRMVNNA